MQYFSEGNSLFEAGKIEEAIQSYNKAIELNPNLAEIHYNKGVALFNLKNTMKQLNPTTVQLN